MNLLHAPSLIYSSFRSNQDLDETTPLLPEHGTVYQKQDTGTALGRLPSLAEEKAPLHEEVFVEGHIGHGCSLTQTIFNGKQFQLCSIFRISSPLFQGHEVILSPGLIISGPWYILKWPLC